MENNENNKEETLRPTEEAIIQRPKVDEKAQMIKKIVFFVAIVAIMVIVKVFFLN